jgi:PAS domain S-box-containing protein
MPKPIDKKAPQLGTSPMPPFFLSAIIDSIDDAVITKNLDGVITTWNKGAERIFGYPRDEAIGRPVTMLLPADLQSEEIGMLEKIKQGEQVEPFETVRVRKDGSFVDVSVNICPIRAENGEVVGASKVARDISVQKRNARASNLLAAIVTSSEDAIISKSLEGIVTSWNVGASKMFGYTEEEMLGRSILVLLPLDRRDEEAGILSRLRSGERVEHFETIRLRKNGETFPVSLTISPVRDATGKIVGASKIARDISELRRISGEREHLLQSERAARWQAERANQLKDDFIATVSHELRTPLNAIVGWTEVLKEGVHDPDVIEAVSVIERNARAQAQLIDDLLDLGRITSGKLLLSTAWLAIDGVIEDAVASIRHAAEAKQIELKTSLEPISSGVMADRNRLQQVLWNLLTNAIKFTPRGGTITVSSKAINSSVEIDVTDDGCGIAPDFLPHVFERFRQADSSTTRQFGGMGIGLALVKQLIDAHGGSVRASSRGAGQGTTFAVRLPLISRPSESPFYAPARNGERRDDLTQIRVLLVDDDRDSLAVLKRILENRNAIAEVATCMDEALVLFESFRPNIVLSDIGMPVHDGYELIRRLRKLPGGATVPAVALTAMARPEDRVKALLAGYQAHLGKPIALAEVLAVIRSLARLQISHAN